MPLLSTTLYRDGYCSDLNYILMIDLLLCLVFYSPLVGWLATSCSPIKSIQRIFLRAGAQCTWARYAALISHRGRISVRNLIRHIAAHTHRRYGRRSAHAAHSVAPIHVVLIVRE